MTDQYDSAAENSAGQATDTLLLFEVSGARMGVSLSLVTRLEEFSVGNIETSGGQCVVQYRGHIMPLLFLSEVFGGEKNLQGRGSVLAIVHRTERCSIALIVDKILDIVTDAVSIKATEPRRGIRGSAIVQSKVTDLIDIPDLITEFIPEVISVAGSVTGKI